MLIKESTLRRIIREEAYRSLREAVVSPLASGQGPLTSQELLDVGTRMGMTAGAAQSVVSFESMTQNAPYKAFIAANRALSASVASLLKSTPTSLTAAKTALATLMKEGNDGTLGKAIANYLSVNATTIGAIGCLVAGNANTNGPIFAGVSGNITSGIDIIKTKDSGVLTDGGTALKTACQNDTTVLTNLRIVVSTSVRKLIGDMEAEKLDAASAAGSAATAANTTPYTVVAGDTISKIALARYGIKPAQASMPLYDQLAKTINRPGATANAIKVGDIINLPASLDGKARK